MANGVLRLEYFGKVILKVYVYNNNNNNNNNNNKNNKICASRGHNCNSCIYLLALIF